MALKTTIKLSGVNNLSDARYGAGMGVEFIGFPLDGPREITTEKYNELKSWVAGPSLVAEFENCEINRILEVISACHPDYIQITDHTFISDLNHIELPIIYKCGLKQIESMPANLKVRYILLEEDGDQAVSENDLTHLKQLSGSYDVLLGTGISLDTLPDLLNSNAVSGFALRGGDEIRPGYKDYDEIADILEYLEIN